MAIATLDQYIAASKQVKLFKKTGATTSIAGMLTTIMAAAGNPGTASLTLSVTASGEVPTDATTGFPLLQDFAGGATGYLSRFFGYNTVASNLYLVDVLFRAGSYAFNADTTLSSPPSFASRVPGGNYSGLELWIEAATAFTGNQTIQVNYLDQDGNAGDTGAVATGVAPIAARMLRLPLAAGDSGISGITRVRSSVSTVGTFNVLIVRPLASMRIPVAYYGESRDLYQTGMPVVYQASALAGYVKPDSTAAGLAEFEFEIASA